MSHRNPLHKNNRKGNNNTNREKYNPAFDSSKKNKKNFKKGLHYTGHRAIIMGCRSKRHKKNADVAQLAEQLICNQQVIGSSPIIGFFGPLAQLVRAIGS